MRNLTRVNISKKSSRLNVKTIDSVKDIHERSLQSERSCHNNVMIKRHQLMSFKKEVSPLLELVTNDIYLESVWLSVMSMLEDIAAQYILSNITEATPTE